MDGKALSLKATHAYIILGEPAIAVGKQDFVNIRNHLITHYDCIDLNSLVKCTCTKGQKITDYPDIIITLSGHEIKIRP